MKKRFKIPTLPAIAFLLLSLVSIIIVTPATYQTRDNVLAVINQNPQPPTEVSEFQVANITHNQVTLIYLTKEKTPTNVIWGDSVSNLNHTSSDDRDGTNNQFLGHTHFSTIKNLSPNTQYFIQVKNGNQLFPEKPLAFKTAAKDGGLSLDPLTGKVFSLNLTPVDEAIIFFKTPGLTPLATYTLSSGNFLLPLKNLYKTNLNPVVEISKTAPSSLLIYQQKLTSEVKFTLSITNQPLPPIVAGTNYSYLQDQTIATTSAILNQTKSFDLNSDNQVNSIDLSLLTKNLNSKDSKYDLNSDNSVDNKDYDLLKSKIK